MIIPLYCLYEIRPGLTNPIDLSNDDNLDKDFMKSVHLFNDDPTMITKDCDTWVS